MRQSVPSGCLALVVLLGLLFFPLFLADVILAALSKLGLSPTTAILAALGIFLGGLVNIPVKRIAREVPMEVPPMLFGLERFVPRQVVRRQYTVIAVNVGGCLVPTLIAVYELMRIAGVGSMAMLLAILAIAINVGVCYSLAGSQRRDCVTFAGAGPRSCRVWTAFLSRAGRALGLCCWRSRPADWCGPASSA